MRLIRAHVQNFKLLEDVQLEFSTKRDQPLTVIRAENGSGKTSLLYAFQWAFWGMSGLPSSARSLRLTSSATPIGKATTVSVMIEFEVRDDRDDTGRYRLVRSVVETPSEGDTFERQPERIRLLQITSAGEEEKSSPDSWIRAWMPERLREVFFTDGDSVQTFISGEVATRQRQDRVQNAIRDLLGIEALRVAVGDIDASFKNFRAEAAKSGGRDTSDMELDLEETDAKSERLKGELRTLRERLANMAEQRTAWEKELSGLRGIGDIDELNDRIEEGEREHSRLENQRLACLTRMRGALKSEDYSWHGLADQLQKGVQVLDGLVDRRVIPGVSVEVLADRLEIGECICGQSLAPGSEHRGHVESLLDEQRGVPGSRQRLTELAHLARQTEATERAKREAGQAFSAASSRLLSEFTSTRDSLRAKAAGLSDLKDRRSRIDEDRVRDLASHVEDVRAKIAQANQEVGGKERDLEAAQDLKAVQEDQLQKAEKAAAISEELVVKRDVAQDLANLANGVLGVLEKDYVARVSERMKDIFMEIVGSYDDPAHEDFGPVLFTGVHIDSDFNINVDTHDGRRLDPDFELNGASKRALTLSFIWALMEVSGVTAPRIIDTPLGMVSGGVKSRMVDAITRPPGESLPEFQVVLFLTRSEIRDVEELIEERGGTVVTLSCSHHYPVDLVYSWDTDYALSRVCPCNHRESCRICARRYDGRHGVHFREEEGALAK